MRKHTKAWYEKDMEEELQEYYEESALFKRWSELSDLSYAYSRARWNGHNINFPFGKVPYFIGLIYMFPKYSGRWLFFRRAGHKTGAAIPIREVRNPKKIHKLHHIAEKNSIDPVIFENVCKQQLRYWPLLS